MEHKLLTEHQVSSLAYESVLKLIISVLDDKQKNHLKEVALAAIDPRNGPLSTSPETDEENMQRIAKRIADVIIAGVDEVK